MKKHGGAGMFLYLVFLVGWAAVCGAQTPMPITTVEQLQAIGASQEALNRDYILVKDIDAKATKKWNGGKGFKPISGYQGTFDGQGHVIRNLYINRPDEDHVGLFGDLADGYFEVDILNLGLVAASITGRNEVGGIAGALSQEDFIGNCHVSGRIRGGVNVGGIAGFSNGPIGYTCNRASVLGSQCIGGIAGLVYEFGGIGNSYNLGTVYGTTEIGGLAGMLYGEDTYGAIGNSFNMAPVLGKNRIGGLVGILRGGNMFNTYDAGPVVGSAQTGGTVGFFNDDDMTQNYGTMNCCFWNRQTSRQNTAGDAVPGGCAQGISIAEMMAQATFTGAGWDFVQTWKIWEGLTFPYLRNVPAPWDKLKWAKQNRRYLY